MCGHSLTLPFLRLHLQGTHKIHKIHSFHGIFQPFPPANLFFFFCWPIHVHCNHPAFILFHYCCSASVFRKQQKRNDCSKKAMNVHTCSTSRESNTQDIENRDFVSDNCQWALLKRIYLFVICTWLEKELFIMALVIAQGRRNKQQPHFQHGFLIYISSLLAFWSPWKFLFCVSQLLLVELVCFLSVWISWLSLLACALTFLFLHTSTLDVYVLVHEFSTECVGSCVQDHGLCSFVELFRCPIVSMEMLCSWWAA